MGCCTIGMYDPISERPKHLWQAGKWLHHGLSLVVNLIKRIWQSFYSAEKVVTHLQSLSAENFRYLNPNQLKDLENLYLFELKGSEKIYLFEQHFDDPVELGRYATMAHLAGIINTLNATRSATDKTAVENIYHALALKHLVAISTKITDVGHLNKFIIGAFNENKKKNPDVINALSDLILKCIRLTKNSSIITELAEALEDLWRGLNYAEIAEVLTYLPENSPLELGCRQAIKAAFAKEESPVKKAEIFLRLLEKKGSMLIISTIISELGSDHLLSSFVPVNDPKLPVDERKPGIGLDILFLKVIKLRDEYGSTRNEAERKVAREQDGFERFKDKVIDRLGEYMKACDVDADIYRQSIEKAKIRKMITDTLIKIKMENKNELVLTFNQFERIAKLLNAEDLFILLEGIEGNSQLCKYIYAYIASHEERDKEIKGVVDQKCKACNSYIELRDMCTKINVGFSVSFSSPKENDLDHQFETGKKNVRQYFRNGQKARLLASKKEEWLGIGQVEKSIMLQQMTLAEIHQCKVSMDHARIQKVKIEEYCQLTSPELVFLLDSLRKTDFYKVKAAYQELANPEARRLDALSAEDIVKLKSCCERTKGWTKAILAPSLASGVVVEDSDITEFHTICDGLLKRPRIRNLVLFDKEVERVNSKKT